MSNNIKTHKKRRSETKNQYNKSDLHIDSNNTLIILDWDDTLYPTSWAFDNNIDLTNPKSRYKYINHFSKLDKYLSSTLKDMKSLGHVIIITNAMPEWVELSVSMLPKTGACLKDIEVISARQKFQNRVKMSEWKKFTFKEALLNRMSEHKYNNILSLGDAEYEHNALINLYQWDLIPHKYLKSIKFIKSSDYEVLLDQIKIIKKHISQICSTQRQLDLTFATQ